MKLMMFEKAGGAALGLLENGAVVDLATADASLPKDLHGLMLAGTRALTAAKAAAAALAAVSARVPASIRPCRSFGKLESAPARSTTASFSTKPRAAPLPFSLVRLVFNGWERLEPSR